MQPFLLNHPRIEGGSILRPFQDSVVGMLRQWLHSAELILTQY